MPTPDLLEVRSALSDDTNQPIYGNCTLTLGDGSVKVQFENGRALVERSVIDQYLRNNGGIEVPTLGIWRQRGGAAADMPVQSGDSDLRGGVEADEEAIEAAVDQLPASEKAGLIGKLLGQLGVSPERAAALAAEALGGTPPVPDSEDEEPSPSAAAPDDGKPETAEARKLRETAEEVARLEAEGELDPDADGDPSGAKAPARVVPAGFEDKTQEDQLRCLAKKGDGEQCKNPAVDGGSACKLPAHQAQFTS